MVLKSLAEIDIINLNVKSVDKLITEITGFDELQKQIKRLPDKIKRREILKILRRSARSTIQASRQEAPQSNRKGKSTPVGNLKKSIKAATMRRSSVPMIVVGPRSSGKYDGWYGRLFVIPGHNIYRGGFRRSRKGNRKFNDANRAGVVPPNPFMERGFARTGGRVAKTAVKSTERYIQKQIDRLS